MRPIVLKFYKIKIASKKWPKELLGKHKEARFQGYCAEFVGVLQEQAALVST